MTADPKLPPPLHQAGHRRADRTTRKVILLAVAITIVGVGAFIFLNTSNLIHLYDVPAGSMAPAIQAGDRLFTQGFGYMKSDPQRGDIVVFKTDDLPGIPVQTLYTKRVVGLPGEELAIKDGRVLVNGAPATLRNRNGDIEYVTVRYFHYLSDSGDTFIVPKDQYFVLGDNSKASADSREFGAVPRKSILGRVVYCYWPPAHSGSVR